MSTPLGGFTVASPFKLCHLYIVDTCIHTSIATILCVWVCEHSTVKEIKAGGPSYLKRYLAQTMQWMGSDGVFLMVHPGKVF